MSVITGVNEKYLAATLALQKALKASEKLVKIEIEKNDLQFLKDNSYRLCVAKKVADDDYNVVWQSYDGYLMSNKFFWTPQYQIFGTNSFKEHVQVEVSTNLVTIGLDETCTLNTAGILSDPRTSDPQDGRTAITMINEYGPINVGLNQLSTGFDGKQVCSPIYVAPKQIVKGKKSLTPVEMVQVWFEQNIQTSTIFTTARSHAVEIDLTSENSQVRLYKDGDWQTV